MAKTGPKSPQETEERNTLIRELREDGHSYREIARQLSTSFGTIRKVLAEPEADPIRRWHSQRRQDRHEHRAVVNGIIGPGNEDLEMSYQPVGPTATDGIAMTVKDLVAYNRGVVLDGEGKRTFSADEVVRAIEDANLRPVREDRYDPVDVRTALGVDSVSDKTAMRKLVKAELNLLTDEDRADILAYCEAELPAHEIADLFGIRAVTVAAVAT